MNSSEEPPAYLTSYLNDIAKAEDFIDYSLHYECGSNHGDGFVAVMIAVSINGKQMRNLQDEKQLNLMCKIIPANKSRRENFNSMMLFEREVCMYNEMLPMFKKFQIERNIPMDEGFSMYPKCYLAVADSIKDHYVIVMENLKTAGYELWDKMKPVDFDTSSIFLASLGRFHGISYAIRDQKPELFQKIIDLENVLVATIESPTIMGMMLGAFDKAMENLVNQDEINLLRKCKINYKSLTQKVCAPNAAGRFAILSHGDCWNNNFCFSSDENEKMQKICLFDWQVSGAGSPALDLSYYFFTSTTKELRSRCPELLRVYHDSMSALVTKLGSDPNKLCPFDELENQLKQFGLYGVLLAPVVLQIIVSDSKNIVDMKVLNEDTQNLNLATFNDVSKIAYSERISDVLQDALKFGWIDF